MTGPELNAAYAEIIVNGFKQDEIERLEAMAEAGFLS